MITEDYVSFETAKLLKEKGFDVYVSSFYDDEGTFSRKEADWNWNIGPRYSAPTLQMAAKWLRDNYHLNPVPYALSLGWAFDIFDLTSRDITGCRKVYSMDLPAKSYCFESYEEAWEAAIKYCFKNLI